MLGFTGELFTVAPLILAIVSALLMTDSATMEIKMETLCQCDMHAKCKFMGAEVRSGPRRQIRKVIKAKLNTFRRLWCVITGYISYKHDDVSFIYRSQNIIPLFYFIKFVVTDV